MSKVKSVFVCNECGYESQKWIGKCPSCNNWNSLTEEIISFSQKTSKTKSLNKVVELNNILSNNETRISTGISELDRVLGGGLVNGSLVLLGGEPGIGKSTLILQICQSIKTNGKILYISGEESGEQIKIRADRLNIKNPNLLFLGETDIQVIEENILQQKPDLVIIDSIQTMISDQISSPAGSVSQVREITSRIMRICKENLISTIIIGHVTKEGNIAGPRVLEHMVDTVLYLEGERYFSYRLLRGVKNRFGSTNEVGMFEMQNKGLIEVLNPSKVLISQKENDVSGSCVVATLEGSRPLMVEIQALTTQSVFALPRRATNGIDSNKLTLLMAVLEKKAGLNFSNKDVYVNVASGIKLYEPAIDLGIIFSAVSSYKNKPIPSSTVIMGEVGLTGEIRNISMIEKRLIEAEKLGFKKAIIPKINLDNLTEKFNIELIGVSTIEEAIKKMN